MSLGDRPSLIFTRDLQQRPAGVGWTVKRRSVNPTHRLPRQHQITFHLPNGGLLGQSLDDLVGPADQRQREI